MSQNSHRYSQQIEIARGGMSTIYRAFDQTLRRDVALKVLDVPASLEDQQRFLEEAQITSQLEHPNIVPIYDLGVDAHGTPYFALKLIKGKTLFELLHQHEEHHSEEELYRFLQIFQKVCDALSFAHSKGIVHRDLKPENIMVGSHGQVYLMDWGLMRVVEGDSSVDILRDVQTLDLDTPGEAMGSFLYLPPEQAHGKLDQIDERTDIFALGAVLYEILTKMPVYMGWSHEDLLAKAKRCEIAPPQELVEVSLPVELCAIAMRALQKEPAERYPSIEALQGDLERFMQGSGRLQEKHFAKGSQIVWEGEEGHEAYLIVKGRCRATKFIDGQPTALRDMGPGDVFGETAAFSSRPRTASVEALDDVTLKVIDKQILAQEFGFGSWINRVLKALAARFAEIDRETVEQSSKLKQSTLLNHLLLHLHLHGATEDGRLEASWSRLQQVLCPRLSLSREELREQLKRVPGVEILPQDNRLTLDPLHLSNQLGAPEHAETP